MPPIISVDGGLVCVSVGKADLLSGHFDSKQSRKAVDLPLTCHASSSLTTFAFRSSEVRYLLLDLDPYGGTDPLGIFPLFLKKTADVMAPRLSVMFQRLVRLGSFPACWRQAKGTQIPKGPPSSSVANYGPISITSVLSKVFERVVSVRLRRFMECSGVLPTTQFAYRKGLGTCNAPLCMSHALQSSLESRQEARIVLIDFSTAFDRVNHLGILYKLCSVSIGGSVLSILTQFLSNRSQQVMVDGCQSKLVDVVSGVPQGCVLDPLLFLLYTSELLSILENMLIGYADDSTLMAVVPSPGFRVSVAESLIRDLGRVREWCDLCLWGMKLNARKTKTMIVSRSRTVHPQSPPLTIGRTVLNESDDLVIFAVTFDSKIPLRSIFARFPEQLFKDLVY